VTCCAAPEAAPIKPKLTLPFAAIVPFQWLAEFDALVDVPSLEKVAFHPEVTLASISHVKS